MRLWLFARICSLATVILSNVLLLLGDTEGAIHMMCAAIFLWLIAQEDDEE